VRLIPADEQRVWSIEDDGSQQCVAELSPEALVHELNRRLYRQREWGKKHKFDAGEADAELHMDPTVLSVSRNIAYARIEMEQLAYCAQVGLCLLFFACF
jgi:hypothetical protein